MEGRKEGRKEGRLAWIEGKADRRGNFEEQITGKFRGGRVAQHPLSFSLRASPSFTVKLLIILSRSFPLMKILAAETTHAAVSNDYKLLTPLEE